MLFVHIAESLSQAGNFRKEVSPELDDLHLPVEAGLDEVLQHLVLTALTVNMEQSIGRFCCESLEVAWNI